MGLLDKFRNVKLILKKLNADFLNVLKKTVHVKTGALKRSLVSKQRNGGFEIDMLEYGNDPNVWTSNELPISVLRRTQKSFKKKLSEAFKKDITTEIKKIK